MNERNQPRRKRNRSRSRGGSPQQKNQGGQKNAAPKVDPEEFWGNPERLPDRIDGLQHSPDVRAVLHSLGRPPLTGNETPAEHWFSMVYERAAFLAGALAAAGDLDDPTST
ncbi:MAG: hypothetical protein RIB98_10595 [Acidimicrobiales bacterium]